MGVGTILLVWLFSAFFGAWTALGIVQAVSGRFILLLPRFTGRASSWTQGAIKLSGWSWAICGLAGLCMALVGGLEFGARVIPIYWAGSPWGLITGNPWPLVMILTVLFQLLIDRHQKKRLKG